MSNNIVLVGCEESQATTKAFRALGYEAYSCDLLPCSGGHPEWHFQEDVFAVIDRIKPKLSIFHPPCTFVTSSGVRWLSHPDDTHLPFDDRRPHPRHPNRRKDLADSVDFVKRLYNTDIPHLAIENPIGLLSSRWRKPDQIIHPWMFGDPATKGTCLWLKGLDKLKLEVTQEPELEYVYGKNNTYRMQKWMYDVRCNTTAGGLRASLASKTFPGIARAFAEQWGRVLN